MRTLIVDSQLLSNIQRCPQRVNLYFEKDLRTPTKPLPLERGELIHQFFSRYYGSRMQSGNMRDWNSCAAEAFDFAKPLTAKMNLDDKEINNTFRSLEQYVEHYKYEPMEVLHVESPFAMELYKNEEEDLMIVYVGVIDLIAKIQGSEQKVFDHKSQSRRSDYLLLDDQFEGYATATKTNILTVNVVGLQTSVAPIEKFRRVPLSYPPFLLERWKNNAVYWIKQYLVWIENQEFAENHQGCNKFSLCEFFGVCSSVSDAARAWKIQSEFVVGEKWDPTKVLNNRE
jgi:hypothetical protein